MAINGTNNLVCPKPMSATSNGVWQGDNPINFALPLLIIQICLVLVVTRTLAFFLKYLRQPRVIAEIVGGILLGPSAFGRSSNFLNKIFPKQSITVLDTVADLGLLFFLFLVGLELDLRAIRKTGRQAFAIAFAGISLPFVAGVGTSVVLHNTIAGGVKFAPFLVFMGVAMSITAFPVLARILAERRLLTTDVGQMAMSAAAVNDVVAWILLALAVALSGSNKSPLIAAWVLLCGLAFVFFMFLVTKPIMTWIAQQAIENEPLNELHVCITLAGVLAAGFVTDSIGIHAIFGAFVFGLIVPKDGPFAGILIEKIEDLVTILMLPLYFASSGLKTNIGSIHGAQSVGLLILVIVTACAGKIIGTFIVAMLHKMKLRKSLTLGFLMNTKGLVELIVLNIGKDRKVLNDETFAIMVLMALFTTFITTPVVMALYKPARNPVPYTRRKVEISKPDAELRILACVHGITNVQAVINLVEAARGTRKHALYLSILHLVEFSERSSSIMRVQRARKDGRPFWNKRYQDMDNIVVAFEAYGQLSKVTVRPMTAISSFADMYHDVCTTAAEKRAAIIILPFHKYTRHVDGTFESQNSGLRTVNLHVLQYAPCSVGILIDRGIGVAAMSSSRFYHNVAVLFCGGPDDREALAFGCRMAEHPGVKLTVYHFTCLSSSDHSAVTISQTSGISGTDAHLKHLHPRISSFHYVMDEHEWRNQETLDEQCLEAIRQENRKEHVDTTQSIFYEEKKTGDPVDAAKSIGKNGSYNIILTGRARRLSPALAQFAYRTLDSGELGPIGDALCDPEVQASVLVIQQHDPTAIHEVSSSKRVATVHTHVDPYNTPQPSDSVAIDGSTSEPQSPA